MGEVILRLLGAFRRAPGPGRAAGGGGGDAAAPRRAASRAGRGAGLRDLADDEQAIVGLRRRGGDDADGGLRRPLTGNGKTAGGRTNRAPRVPLARRYERSEFAPTAGPSAARRTGSAMDGRRRPHVPQPNVKRDTMVAFICVPRRRPWVASSRRWSGLRRRRIPLSSRMRLAHAVCAERRLVARCAGRPAHR